MSMLCQFPYRKGIEFKIYKFSDNNIFRYLQYQLLIKYNVT